MTFDEILAEVNEWTKRPDLEASARSAIRTATLYYHRREKFWKDLITVTVGGMASGFIQQIDIADKLPNFRQLNGVRVTGYDRFLEIVNANDLLDLDGYARTEIVFPAGTVLNVKCVSPVESLDITYWRDPIVSPSNLYVSWIAAEQPDLIIAAAAARVLAFDNESDLYRAAKVLEAEQWMQLIQTNLEAQGR